MMTLEKPISDKTLLEQLVEQGIQETKSVSPMTDFQRMNLQSLLRQSEIETGIRPKTAGETIEGALMSALHNAIKVPVMGWKSLGRAIAERKRDFEFAEYFAKKWTPEKLAQKGLDKDILRLEEIRQKEYEIYKKKNKVAVDVPDSIWNKIFNAPYESVEADFAAVYKQRPDLQNEPIEGVGDLVKNPRKLVSAIIESTPTLVSAGILTATGHPALAYATVAAAEGSDAYEEAIADGASEEEAMQAFKIYGLSAAAVEMVQIGQGIRFLKQIGKHASAKLARKVLINETAKKISKKIASEGEKALTREWLKTAVLEAGEEAFQGQLQEWTQRYVYGKKQEGGLSGWINRRGVEAMIAFGMSAPLGIPAVGVDIKGGQMRRTAEAIQHDQAAMKSHAAAVGLEESDYAVPHVLGRQHRNIERFVRTVFGKRVAWFVPYTEKAGQYNGWTSPEQSDVILLNAAMNDPMTSVAIHEVVHQIEKDDPQAYHELKNIIFDYISDLPQIQQDIQGRFGRVGLAATPQAIESEVVAEVVGRLAQDPNFLDRVAGRSPNALVRAQRWFLKSAKRAITSRAKLQEDEWLDPFISDMAELSDKAAIALHNYGVKTPVLQPIEAEIAEQIRQKIQAEIEELENLLRMPQEPQAPAAAGVEGVAPKGQPKQAAGRPVKPKKKTYETRAQKLARLKRVYRRTHPHGKKAAVPRETRQEKLERLKETFKKYHPRASLSRTGVYRAYHGTPTAGLTLDKIDPKKAIETAGAVFFTSNEDIAIQFTYPREYGEVVTERDTGRIDEETGEPIYEAIEPGAVIAADIELKNPLVIEGQQAQNAIDNTTEQLRIIEKAKAAGHDGVIFKNVHEFADPFSIGDVYAVFDKSQIRPPSSLARPSLARLPYLQQKLADSAAPATDLKKGLQYSAEKESIQKGWVLDDGSVIPVKPVFIGDNKISDYGINNWEHYDHARSLGETIKTLIAGGAVRIARFKGTRSNEIVFEYNPDLLTSEKTETMLNFAIRNSERGEINHITARARSKNQDGYGCVEYTNLSEVPDAFQEAVRSAKLAMEGKPSIARRRTTKQQIHIATGFRKTPSPSHTMTEEQLLKAKLKAEQKAARLAYLQGWRDMRQKLLELQKKHKKYHEIRRMLIAWVQNDIPKQYQYRMIKAINYARTEKSVDRAVERLTLLIDDVLRRQELANLKKLMRRIQKKYGYKRKQVFKAGGRFKMAPEFSIVFERIFDAISLKRPKTEGQQEALAELIDYVRREKEAALAELEEGQTTEDNFFLVNEIIPTLERLQNEMARQSIVNLPAESIRDLADSMETLLAQWEWQRNDDPNSFIQQEKANDATVHSAIISEIQSSWKKPIAAEQGDINKRQSPYKIKRLWTGLFGRFNYNLQTLAYIVSGAKKGWLYRMFGYELGHSRDMQKEVVFSIQDFVRREMEAAGITMQELKSWSSTLQVRKLMLPKAAEKWFSEHAPDVLRDYAERPPLHEMTIKLESGQNLRLSVGMALNIVMLCRSNAYQYNAVLKNGLVLPELPGTVFKVNAIDLQNIRNMLPENAKKMVKILDTAMTILQDKINETSVRIDGYQKANIDGYWHIRRFRERQPKGQKEVFVVETIENRSHWKERVGGKDPILIADAFNEFVDTVQVAGEYIGMSVGIRRARRILQNKAIRQMVREKGYEDYWNDMIKLVDAAQDRKGEYDFITSLYGKWIQNVTRAVFAFNLRVAAQQYASVFMSLNDFNIRYLRAIRFVPDKKLEERIIKWSPFLRERFQGHVNRELGDAVSHGGVMRFFTGKDQLINYPTFLVTYFDKLAILDIWRMAELETLEHPAFQGRSKEELYNDKVFMERVMARAEEAIRNTQPTWDVIDRSLIGSTRNPLTRSVTMFHSQREKMAQLFGIANSTYMNTLYQIQQRENLPSLAAAAATKEGLLAAAKVAKSYGLILTNLALVKLWAMLYSAVIYGDEEDQPFAEFATGVISDIPGMFYFGEVGREVIARWSATMRKKPVRPYMYELAPYRVVSSFGAAVGEFGKTVIMTTGPQNYTDAEIKEQLYRALDRAWEAAQYGTGMPFLHATTIAKKRLRAE